MPMSRYTGRRMARGSGSGPARRRRKDHNGRLTAGRLIGRILLFPALFFYWELVLHISMEMNLKYIPVYLVFSIAVGLFFGAITVPFKWRINSILSKILSVIMPVIYCAEMIAKKILQSYYPFSSLETAAGNRLGDYSEAIFSTIFSNIPLILVFFLPTILLFIFGKRHMGYYRFKVLFAACMMAGAMVFHLIGLAVVHLPWSGDLTPGKLYSVDTNIDDQVEQLGVFTMLRLDIKHMISPPKTKLDSDFDGLGALGAIGSTEAPPVTPPPSSGPDSPDDPVESQAPVPVIDTSPNVMDVDLASLAENGKNENIRWLANYFNSVTPTNKNQYTGMFKDYNVIQIVMEGFSGYAIDPELTPTLYKLTHEGFVFNNYYTALHFTSTSNGECQTLLGLYPKNGFPITMKETGVQHTNCYFSLASQLKRLGYTVQAYHANSEMYGRYASHTNLGYDYRQFENGFDNLELKQNGGLLWPQRDSYMIEASIDNYINSDTPFHVYYLTISGHMPYSDNRIVAPYRDTVRALPYTEKTQNYIATAMEVDKALQTLLDKLEAAGKLDKTLIIATGDHIPYFDVDTLEELAGRKFGSSEDLQNINERNIDFDVYRNSLILWSASMEEPVVVDKVCGLVDILPTVSNLLGLEYDSRMLDGSDILSTSDGLVIFSSRCWRSDKGFYDRFTQTFTPAEGVTMTAEEQESYVSAMKKLVGYKLDSTALIVENDFYNLLFPR